MGFGKKDIQLYQLNDKDAMALLAEASAIRDLERQLIPPNKIREGSDEDSARDELFHHFVSALEVRVVLIASQSREPGPWTAPIVLESLRRINQTMIQPSNDFVGKMISQREIEKAALAWLDHKGYDRSTEFGEHVH